MKSTEERSRKPRSELPIDLNKLPPLNRIPRKPRLPKETRDRKRNFSSLSKDQVETSQRARLNEEAAAKELLHKLTEKKAKVLGTDRDPALGSNVKDLTGLVTTMSARDLSRLVDSIKRRRLQLKKPSSPKPAERLQPCLMNTQRKRAELSVETTATINSFPLEDESTSKEALEVRLLQRLLDARNRRTPRVKEVKEEEKSVPQLAGMLESRAMRYKYRILLNFWVIHLKAKYLNRSL